MANKMNNSVEEMERVNCAPIDELLAEGAKRKKRGSSAAAQVTYFTLNKCIHIINMALDKSEDGKGIDAPKLRDELKVCGFSAFSMNCIPFMWGTHTIIIAPQKGESDFRYIQRKDENGRNVYSPAELVRAFESKFEMVLSAERARKDAEREAKRAERAAKRAERDASAKAAANETRKMFEGLMGRALTDAEFEQIVAKIKKGA